MDHGYRMIVRGCRHQADWQVEGQRAAQRAVQTDLNKVRDTILRRLDQATHTPELFPGEAFANALAGVRLTPVELALRERLEADHAFGGTASVPDALESVIEDRVAGMRRRVEVGLAHQPNNRAIILERWDRSIEATGDMAQERVRSVLGDAPPAPAVAPRPAFDRDADLLSGEAFQ